MVEFNEKNTEPLLLPSATETAYRQWRVEQRVNRGARVTVTPDVIELPATVSRSFDWMPAARLEETRTMHTLYTFGYAGADSAKFAEFINEKGWRVFDTRFNPQSRWQQQWNCANLNKAVKKYEHVKALGNVNYKNGGEVKLVDEALGIDAIKKALLDSPVVLLCGCKDVNTCHRSYIAARAREQFGCEVIHLTLADLQLQEAAVKPCQATQDDGHLLIQHGMEGFAPDKLAAKPTQLKLL